MIQSFISRILYQTFTEGGQQKSTGEKNLLKDLNVQIDGNIKKGC